MRARAFAFPGLLSALIFALCLTIASLARAQPSDHTTPRRALESLLEAAHEGDLERAASYLDLRHFEPEKRRAEGPALARALVYITDRNVAVDLEKLPDVPEGAGPEHEPIEFGKLTLRDQTVSLELERIHDKDGTRRWVVSRSTVALIPELDKIYGPARWQQRVPVWLRSPSILGNAPWQWLGIVIVGLLSYAIGRLTSAIVVRVAALLAKRTEMKTDDALVEAGRRPLRLLFGAGLFRWAIDYLDLTPAVETVLLRINFTVVVVAVAWLLVAVARVATEFLEVRLSEGPASSADTRRGLRTQLTVVRRIGLVIVIFVGGAVVLLQFEFMRNLGMSLLASAGIAGIVVGLAAQKTLGALLAGVQLSLAQPVRIGDMVTIENEFGEVEEIHLTYVVIRMWDERRLVVPIQRMLEQTFVNWTRLDSRVLGAAIVHADYTTPIEIVRKELERICGASPLWDKRLCTLVVFDTTETSVVLRALVSAADPRALGDLRHYVRGELVRFLQSFEGGKYLPRGRREAIG